MEYNSQLELYKSLIPVFKVKQRLINAGSNKSVSINDIWQYLAVNKWKYDTNLMLFDIVNDIMLIDIDIIKNEGGK